MNNLYILILISLLALSHSKITNASLIGDTIDAGIYAYDGTRILGYGLDEPFIVAAGISDQKQYSDIFLLNVEANGFYIDYILDCPPTSTCGWSAEFRIFDLNFRDGINGVSVESNAAGWNDSFLTFTDNSVTLHWNAISWDSDTYFDVTLSSVPLPPAVWLLSSGLLGLIGVARRKA